MILINKDQVQLDQLPKRLGIKIPLDLIKKKPLYEINPALIIKDLANGPGAVKHRQAMEFPAYFQAKLDSGEEVTIRYCTNRTPDPKTMGQTEKYAPRVVDFDGRAEFVADDLDKAVYMWIHFFNKTSPFRAKGKPFEYELVDDEAKANALIGMLTLRGKAASHAAQLQGEELTIIAKGMRIAGASTMDPLTLKAQLMQYASDQPEEYLNKAESQVNHVQGLIIDSVDKGIFVMTSEFNSKRWKWAMGVRKGELIVEISNNVPDPLDALLVHISQHIQDFLPVLINTAKTINAKSNLEKAVSEVDVLAELGFGNQKQVNNGSEPNPNDGTDSSQNEKKTLPLPTNYAESVQYLFNAIGSKAPAWAKKLENGVKDKSITYENVKQTLESWVKK